MPSPLKLLQLTDLHLKADLGAEMGGKNIQQHVDAVIDCALQHRHWPADLVAFTGDNVDEIEPENFRIAYHRLADRISQWDSTICCIPGNHDHSASLKEILSGHGIKTLGAFEQGNWQFHLLDSSIPNSPDGELNENQLASFDQALGQRRADHTLVLVHHPVTDINSRWLDNMRVKNGQALTDRLQPLTGTKVVLWGHAHQAFDGYQEDIRFLGTPAACPIQFKPLSEEYAVDENNNAGFRWCLLYPDGQIETEVVRI